MAIEFEINEEQFGELPESLQGEYKKKEDGSYRLDINGYEDPGALRRAKEREVQARKDASQKASDLEKELEEYKSGNAKKSGDIETLEKSWNEKLTKQQKEFADRESKYQGFIKQSLVDNEAQKIANQIATSPGNAKLLMPHIKSRLSADMEGERPSTKVLDGEGNASAMTLQELQAEFVANSDFADIIKGSNATGSGAANDGKGSGGRATPTPDKSKPKSQWTPAEMAAHLKAQRGN